MREKEEDIEVNLTGEELNHSDAADKSRWFKRIRKVLVLQPQTKKRHQKVYGRSAQPVIIFVLVLN